MAKGGRLALVCFLSLFCVCVLSAENVTALGKPLNVPPSQFWDGDDGPWSTFRIGVGGGQIQQLRVLPASDQSTTWLILPEACSVASHASTEDCADLRGGLYMRNVSTTWKEFGQYALNTYLESRVGYDGDGLYGYDVLSMGWTGDGLPTLDNQSIAGIITPNFTVGGLALNPRPINFTDYNNPVPSFLQNLRDMNDTPIPSLSWSYTAGAYNLAPKVFGSLVLGGYDSTRFEPNNLTFPFGADISLDFQVAIQRITANNTNDGLLTTPIISYISTLVPDIWLPIEACNAFQRAFHLSYSLDTEVFYANSSQHALNLASNPVVSFGVGPEVSGASINISMPYWNFYLAAKDADGVSTIEEGGFRFPIRRASKDTEFILGRAFLQSAYLSADYERNTFNLSQALYPSSSTKEVIVPILPLGLLNADPGFSGDRSNSNNRLSTGAIAGIAAGGAVALAVIATIVFLLHRRRKVKKTKGHELEDTDVQNNMSHEVHGDDVKHELGGGLKHELAGDTDPKIELYACNEQEKPAEVADTQIQVYELPAHETKHVELEGEGHLKEMG
ncbi:Nn.00g037130.m01.CDS01 [Neocucurbitaria sp. VM-36]